MEKKIGKELCSRVEGKIPGSSNKASQYALSRGIILADSKFEFGIMDGRLVIADELFTPILHGSGNFRTISLARHKRALTSYICGNILRPLIGTRNLRRLTFPGCN